MQVVTQETCGMKRKLPQEFEHDPVSSNACCLDTSRSKLKSSEMDVVPLQPDGAANTATANPPMNSEAATSVWTPEIATVSEHPPLQDESIMASTTLWPEGPNKLEPPRLWHEAENVTADVDAHPDDPRRETTPTCVKPSALLYGPPNLPEPTTLPTSFLTIESQELLLTAPLQEPVVAPGKLANGSEEALAQSTTPPQQQQDDDKISAGPPSPWILVQQSTEPEAQLQDDSHSVEPLSLPSSAHAFQPAATAPGAAPVQDQSWVTTQIAPAMVPDFDMTDEAYAESTTTSYVTSIASEISNGILENERLYPNYGQHSYGMPVDEDEMDRMDLQHRKYELVLGNKHFLAPLGPNPQKILDLGTGTGIWALDVADMYPSASVIGVDIAPIQPKWVAANCQFEIDDVEATWTYRMDTFDFIHFRDPLYCVRDWPKLARQCYDHLKPGGWCELACIYPLVQCDDGTMPEDSGFKVICNKFMEASAIFGASTESPIRFAKYLRDAGFVNVSENIFKIPSSPWPKDKRLKRIGALEMTNLVEGAAAFSLRAFEQAFGWSKEQTHLAMVNFKRDVKNRAYHQYCTYYVVYGRKPPDSSYSDV